MHKWCDNLRRNLPQELLIGAIKDHKGKDLKALGTGCPGPLLADSEARIELEATSLDNISQF